MSKVIIEFDGVEEQEDIQSALNGYKWKLAMWDLDQELRNTTKYGKSVIKTDGSEACGVEDDVAEKYREKIREILSSYGLMFD
jgi:hypothetical protein